MTKIIQSIIKKGQTKQRPGGKMTPKYITVHNTANRNKGANAEMHARYLHNGAGGRTVGWHFTVDDKEIYQHLPLNEHGWHAGDGARGTGNLKSIGIEICENSDGNFDKAVKNAQALIRQLMDEHNIPLKNVVTHKHWSGKNCPRKLLDDWDGFIKGIKRINSSKKTNKSSKKEKLNKKSISQMADEIIQGKHGSGHENRRKSLGIDKATYKKVRAKVNEKLGAKTSNKSSSSTKKTSSKSIKKGDKVTLSKNASKYATGEKIPAKYKGKTYTVQQVKSDRVLLKELYSWVHTKGVDGSSGSSKKSSSSGSSNNSKSLKVGQKVKIKSSAKKYSRANVTIPARVKGKSYTIQQVGKDDVLLKEIYSWVKKTDIS